MAEGVAAGTGAVVDGAAAEIGEIAETAGKRPSEFESGVLFPRALSFPGDGSSSGRHSYGGRERRDGAATLPKKLSEIVARLPTSFPLATSKPA